VQLIDVPTAPASSSAAANKQKLWDWYHQVIRLTATRGVPGTSQPELKYLALLEMLRNVHNQIRVPAYRRAFEQFRVDSDALKAAAAALTATDPKRRNDARSVLLKHKAALEKIFEPLVTARSRAATEAAEVNEFMRANPGAVGSTSRLRMALRLNLSTDFEISRYLGSVGSPGLLERGQVVPDGWADPIRLPGRSD
jgi:hypothetical protein